MDLEVESDIQDAAIQLHQFLAMEEVDMEFVREVLDDGYPIDSLRSETEGWTPLHAACAADTPQDLVSTGSSLVEFFLSRGCDIDAQDFDERTPLFVSLDLNSDIGRANASILIEHGAGIEIVDKFGRSPMHCVANYDDLENLHRLIELGANVDPSDQSQVTPVMCSSWNNCIGALSFLIEKGVDIDTQDCNGNTALHWASAAGNIECCKMLIASGCDVSLTNTFNKSAFEIYGSRINCNTMDIVGDVDNSSSSRGNNTRMGRDEQLSGVAAMRFSQIEYVQKVAAELSERVEQLEKPARITSTLLFSETFSDLVFEASCGERIYAHRNIVATCSEQLRVLLTGPWRENADERLACVRVEQSATAVRAFLRYLYTGEVDEAACVSHCIELLDLAAQHELQELKIACETCASKAVTVQTVVPLLVASHVHELKNLKKKCLTLIKSKALAMLMSPDFPQLCSAHPSLWDELKADFGLAQEST